MPVEVDVPVVAGGGGGGGAGLLLIHLLSLTSHILFGINDHHIVNKNNNQHI